MSAPPGPGRPRSNSNRSRGNIRGVRSRDPRNGAGRGVGHAGPRPTSTATNGDSSRQFLRPPPNQNQVRNKSWRNPAQLKSAILDHAGKLPDSKKESWRNAATEDGRVYKKRMNDLYQTLKDSRERERKEAIKNGFLADPDKPTSLANAITPVGTCPEMCPEFERVERIVQLMVDGSEKETSDSGARVPCEALMVKRFRRSAAGYDEQLPSDIRPPAVLKKTLDYLFEGVIGGPELLATVHKFVWDRTRGIRNDFSIQQVSKTEDLRIAIDCFERIARFHILSLHQLSRRDAKDIEFDHHQEREQLNNTLLSLMYYYDDSRHKLTSPNEAEFRAYCIIFEIQDQRPDLEDRAQNWPRYILRDQLVQTALKLYAAAANTSDEQGPLRPRTTFSTAQANAGGFWNLVRSNAVSYMMACVAEIYFNLVRSTALEATWNAYKVKRGGSAKVEDWILRDLTVALGFDDQDQTATFCEEHEFEVLENDRGEGYVDLGSIVGGHLKDNNPRRKQIFSKTLVEKKRLARTLPAVINGLTASQAQSQGLVEDSSDAETASNANSESLFLDENSDEERQKPRSRSGSPLKTNNTSQLNSTAGPFNPPSTFGQPSVRPNPFQPTPPNQPQNAPASVFDTNSNGQVKNNPFASAEVPKASHFPTPNNTNTSEKSGPFDTKEPPNFNSFPAPSTSKSEDSKKDQAASPFAQQTLPKTGIFGRPSSSSPTVTAKDQTSESQVKPPTFSWQTSSLFPGTKQEAPTGNTVSGPGSDASSPTSNITAPKAPSISLGTSPLLQPALQTNAGSSVQQTTSEPPENPLSKSQTTTPSSIITPEPQPPPSSLFPPNAYNPTAPSTAFTSSHQSSTPLFPNLQPSPKPPAAGPFNDSAASPFGSVFSQPNNSALPPKPTADPAPSNFTPSSPGVNRPFLSKPTQNAIRTPSPSQRDSPTAALTGSSFQPKTPSSTSLARRSAALDELARTIVLEDGGLLQQYIEFTVSPIIRCSMAQYQDQKSWAKAKEYRAFLLARKYARRWKANAWNLGLKRRGKERRRNLARTLHDSAKKSRSRQNSLENSPFKLPQDTASPAPPQHKPNNHIPPPSTPAQKRQSLPAQLNHDSSQSHGNNKWSKRKRDEQDKDSDQENSQQPKSHLKSHHKRSRTLEGSTMSAPPHRFPRTPHRSSINLSKVGDGSLLSDTLMRQARRLAGPNVRSDTTRTDYFKVKAMGIDPDTPIIPLTKKRAREASDVNEISTTSEPSPKSPKTSSTKLSASQNPTSNPCAAKQKDDDDEAFFASIRAVRDTLAESTTWFQTESQNIERSLTPQTHTNSSSPPRPNNHNHAHPHHPNHNTNTKPESPAERRLREIRERGPTPSRTELRLRAMGDKALLPKGFWDGEGMGKSLYGNGKGKGKGKEVVRGEPKAHSERKGFVALGTEGRGGRVDKAQGDEVEIEDDEEEVQEEGGSEEIDGEGDGDEEYEYEDEDEDEEEYEDEGDGGGGSGFDWGESGTGATAEDAIEL